MQNICKYIFAKTLKKISFEHSLLCVFSLPLNPAGGGCGKTSVRRSPAISHRIILWSQKFLTLSINIPSKRQLSHFFTIFSGFPEIQPRPSQDQDFLGSKITKSIFFNFFIAKFSNFISNLNDYCSQLSFEVYNAFVAKKLRISEFFFVWTLATSTTSRGRNFNLSNFNRVSNFS